MDRAKPPEFLALGHITQDMLPGGGYRWGGTAAYSALTAHRLGYRVAIVTSAAPDPILQGKLEGIEMSIHPSPATTIFRNLYQEGGRRQWLLARAADIPSQAIPAAWREAEVVLLGPVAREVGSEISGIFSPSSLVALSPQGIWRSWEEAGRVRTMPRELGPEWRVKALILSQEDIAQAPDVLKCLAGSVPVVVLTQGERGATLYQKGRSHHFPARKARAHDPTGAGDVFAAAFLVRWHETGDAEEAMSFANIAASLSIEGPGLEGIPTRSEVERARKG